MRKSWMKLAACLTLCAFCAGSVYAEAVPENTEAVETKTIGEKEDGAYEVTLVNGTGREICEFRIRTTEETEFSDNLLKENDVFAADETRIFYYAPEEKEEKEYTEADFAAADAAEAEGQTEAADEKEVTVGYDLQITFSDDKSTAEINAFPFGDIEEGKIMAEDGVAFVVYKSVRTKEEISTKEYALSLLRLAQEAAEKAAAAEQAPADSGSTYSEPSYSSYEEDYSYSEPSYSYDDYDYSYDDYSYSEPSYSEPEYTDAGDDENCIPDGMFY